MTVSITFRFADFNRDGLHTGMDVRILGDTFKHRYSVVGIESRVDREGQRLFGGDSHAVIQTVGGRHRRVRRSQLVAHHAEWSYIDSATAGLRVSHRARRARILAANTAAARAERKAARTRGLSSTVKVLRSTRPGPRESRTRCLASNRGINPEWLAALVNAEPEPDLNWWNRMGAGTKPEEV